MGAVLVTPPFVAVMVDAVLVVDTVALEMLSVVVLDMLATLTVVDAPPADVTVQEPPVPNPAIATNPVLSDVADTELGL